MVTPFSRFSKFVHPTVHSSMYIHLSIRMSGRPPVRPSVCPFVRSTARVASSRGVADLTGGVVALGWARFHPLPAWPLLLVSLADLTALLLLLARFRLLSPSAFFLSVFFGPSSSSSRFFPRFFCPVRRFFVQTERKDHLRSLSRARPSIVRVHVYTYACCWPTYSTP